MHLAIHALRERDLARVRLERAARIVFHVREGLRADDGELQRVVGPEPRELPARELQPTARFVLALEAVEENERSLRRRKTTDFVRADRFRADDRLPQMVQRFLVLEPRDEDAAADVLRPRLELARRPARARA